MNRRLGVKACADYLLNFLAGSDFSKSFLVETVGSSDDKLKPGAEEDALDAPKEEAVDALEDDTVDSPNKDVEKALEDDAVDAPNEDVEDALDTLVEDNDGEAPEDDNGKTHGHNKNVGGDYSSSLGPCLGPWCSWGDLPG